MEITEAEAKQIVNLIGMIVLELIKEGEEPSKEQILMQLEWRLGVVDEATYRTIYTLAIQLINGGKKNMPTFLSFDYIKRH